MVTDIDGNIIDEIRYDTYGKVIARMATDRLVVGYNGRDGVLTDPTGILYMRNRYYSPELRRFMSADKISGSIADSSTLNVFAYVNGNPISFVDPFGLSKEHGQSDKNININLLYEQKEIESKAANKIIENTDNIKYAADFFGIDPNTVASVIFVEQYFNYNWVDVVFDWISFYGIVDMSVGLGQVRISTAKYLEERGYIAPAEATEGGWYIPIVGFVHGTETMAREKRLENDAYNILYVAAYLKSFQDDWETVFPEISDRPDVLGTLYNIGHLNEDGSIREPHSNPGTNTFGDNTKKYYDLMAYLLGD